VIASVKFRNFKALRATSLRLTPFNLVIGANGSGKTSLIQAIVRLRTLAKLAPASSTADGKRSAKGPEISFRFDPPRDGFEARLECVSELVCDALHLIPPNPPGWAELQADIARIRSYVLDHEAISRRVAPPPGGEIRHLSPDGANLGAVLATLRAQSPDAFAALTAEVLRIFPEFSGLEILPAEDGAITFGLVLGDGEGTVAAESLSQGSLYLVAILALAFDPDPPSVLCIEEVDRGVHPRMLREVRDALYRLSYPASFGLSRRPVQVVATTHSPYLVDLFRDHPEEIVIAQKHAQASRFERLSDRADLGELLKEGSLGDMWFSGILGGVPDES
jgi:predicted ATPase